MFYLPLLEPHAKMEQDDDDFVQENQDDIRGNLSVPLKKSLLQIVREVRIILFILLLVHKESWHAIFPVMCNHHQY